MSTSFPGFLGAAPALWKHKKSCQEGSSAFPLQSLGLEAVAGNKLGILEVHPSFCPLWALAVL